MEKTIEIAVLEGLLSWDGRVLGLFRGDGKQGRWRLHGSLVTDVVVERRKDRIDVRFHTTPQFYESAQMPLEQESSLQTLLAAMGC